VEKRTVSAQEITPLESGIPGARTLVTVQSERLQVNKGISSTETRYYISSLAREEAGEEKLAGLIRGHWGAVENRTHWKRDALMGEDGMRSREPVLLANVALIRNALLTMHAAHYEGRNLVELSEAMHRRPALALHLIRAPWP